MKAKSPQIDTNLINANNTYSVVSDNKYKNVGSLFLGTVMIPTMIASFNTVTDTINYSGVLSSEVFPAHQELNCNSKTIDLQRAINHLHLNELSNLEDGWNSYNGKRFDKSDIDSFSNTLDSLNKQPTINPTGRKSIYFEYVFNDTKIGYELFSNKLTEVIVSNGDYKNAIMNNYSDDFAAVINASVMKYS